MSNTQPTTTVETPSLQKMDWSDVVFAYGHLFAPESKLLGIEVPMHDVKIKREALAQMMLVADVIGLEQVGALALNLGQHKGLLMSSERVCLTKSKDAEVSGAVMRAMLGQIGADANKNNVRDIVYRLLGRDQLDPFAVVANWAKDALVKGGYYTAQERGQLAQMVAGSKLVPNRERLAALAPLAETMQSNLKNAEMKNAALYKRLLQDTIDALRARVKQDER